MRKTIILLIIGVLIGFCLLLVDVLGLLPKA